MQQQQRYARVEANGDGSDSSATAASRPLGSGGMNPVVWYMFLLALLALVASLITVLVYYTVHNNGNGETLQNNRLTYLESNTTLINATLSDEIDQLNDRVTVLESVTSPNETGILSINGEYSTPIVRNFDMNVTGTGLNIVTVPGESRLEFSNTGVTSLAALGSGISVSGATGSVTIENTGVTSLNIFGSGLSVSNATGDVIIENTGVTFLNAMAGLNVSATTGIISIENTGVLTITGVSPTGGNVNLVGTSGIDVIVGPGVSDVTISGMTLATAIDNLDMVTMTHTQEIMELQTQINNINITSMTIDEMLQGGLDMFNMTLMSLLMQIATLQQTVDALVANNNNSATTPTGTMVPWAGVSSMVPDGYLLCDGSMQLQATYPELFSVIGCAYCSMAMCTMSQFCLPDMRGRVPVGEKTTMMSAFTPRGGTTGEEKHTLLTTELAQHIHGANAAGSHSHGGATNTVTNFNSDVLIGLSSFTPLDSGNLYPANTPLYTPQIQADLSNTCGLGDGDWRYAGINAFPGSRCGSAVPFTTIAAGIATPVAGSTSHGHVINADGTHTHVPAAEGSNVPHNNIQPSTTVGGYIIKT